MLTVVTRKLLCQAAAVDVNYFTPHKALLTDEIVFFIYLFLINFFLHDNFGTDGPQSQNTMIIVMNDELRWPRGRRRACRRSWEQKYFSRAE